MSDERSGSFAPMADPEPDPESRVLAEFGRAIERAGRGAESVAPVLALLAKPPSPPSHSAARGAAS